MAVEGNNDICKQQQQSSFGVTRLSASSDSKEQCAEFCCKDSRCTIPLRVKKHCYGVYCAKKELCQIVFEQLKDFQGHRVDKRDADDEDDDENGSENWEGDQKKALGIYQKRDNFGLNVTDDTQYLYGREGGSSNQGFPAFLVMRPKRELLEDRGKLAAIDVNNSSKDFQNYSILSFFIISTSYFSFGVCKAGPTSPLLSELNLSCHPRGQWHI